MVPTVARTTRAYSHRVIDSLPASNGISLLSKFDLSEVNAPERI